VSFKGHVIPDSTQFIGVNPGKVLGVTTPRFWAVEVVGRVAEGS